MNSANLIGRLTRDPDIRYTQEQMCVAHFTLAVDRPAKKGKKAEADFISCAAFGKTAEIVEKYVRKGNQMGLSGRIRTGAYTNKDGQKVYTTEVVTDRVYLIGGRSKAEEPDQPDPNDVPAPEGFDYLDDDLPF